MKPTRRSFLIGSAAATFVPVAVAGGAGAMDDPWVTLRAGPGTARLLSGRDTPTAVWGFNGTAPGPTLRSRKGETLNVRLENALGQPTAVHWHGIRIDNAMDGVAGLTQDPVQPGETFEYAFTTPDAGTYWYHSHNRSWEQVARGMHGVLIVEEEQPPAVDRDIVLAIDDWRLDASGEIDSASFGHMMDLSHGGRLGNVITINGSPEAANLEVRTGERIRLRLCNVANARIFEFRIDAHAPRIVALDGQPVEPRALPDRGVVLAPGQRTDLIVDAERDPGSRHPLVLGLGRDEIEVGALIYNDTEVARSRPLDAPAELPSNGLPASLPLALDADVTLDLAGGAMGRMATARFRGTELGIRELVREGMAWALNGEAGMPEKPLFSARIGQRVGLTMTNSTSWPHAMHWHGHHAFVRRGGSIEPDGVWRDTVLSMPGESIEVVFNLDNPGKWLLHCHMLEHQAAGMKTWFEVTA